MSAFMRCKFKINGVRDCAAQPGQPRGVTVEMGAVYEPDDKKRSDPASENSIFGKYTPHGEYKASIYNPSLVELLPTLLGKEVYIDFTVV